MKKLFLALMLAIASMSASLQAQITAPAVEARPETDAKYLTGAIPTVDGHAVLTREIDVKAQYSADSVMTLLDSWLGRCIKDERVLNQQRLEETKPQLIQHLITLEMTFSKSFLAHDYADINFVLELDATQQGKVEMRMTRISFRYNEGDNKIVKYQAEELIADDIAINKKGKMVFGFKKFRMKTIDLMDELTASLQKELQ